MHVLSHGSGHVWTGACMSVAVHMHSRISFISSPFLPEVSGSSPKTLKLGWSKISVYPDKYILSIVTTWEISTPIFAFAWMFFKFLLCRAQTISRGSEGCFAKKVTLLELYCLLSPFVFWVQVRVLLAPLHETFVIWWLTGVAELS